MTDQKCLMSPLAVHHHNNVNLCPQGAGGEPMEISEQVGMTPEIIQKVKAYVLLI